MKTNVGIELTDESRNRLACLIDGKATKRLATRAEVCALADGFVQGLAMRTPPPLTPELAKTLPNQYSETRTREIPEHFRELLAGKSEGYVRGFLMADKKLRAHK